VDNQRPGLHPYLRAFGLGVVAGLRSITAPAVATLGAGHGAGRTLALVAAGELIADKLPAAPSRLAPAPLVLRIASGGYAGSTMVARHGGARQTGVLLGALGAVAGALGGFYARRAAVDRLGLPEVAVALAEDVLAVGGALAICGPPTRPSDRDG